MGEIIQKAMDTVEWPKSPTNSTKRKLCVRNYWDELYALLCFLTLHNVSPYIRQEGTHRYCRRILSIIYVCSYHRLHSLQCRHNGPDSISNHQPHDCLHNRVFRRRSKETSKLRVTGLCAGNSPHKWPVTRKKFPFDDVIMLCRAPRITLETPADDLLCRYMLIVVSTVKLKCLACSAVCRNKCTHSFNVYVFISMRLCKKDVTPLL